MIEIILLVSPSMEEEDRAADAFFRACPGEPSWATGEFPHCRADSRPAARRRIALRYGTNLRKGMAGHEVAAVERVEVQGTHPEALEAACEALHILSPVDIRIRQNHFGIAPPEGVGVSQIVRVLEGSGNYMRDQERDTGAGERAR